MTLKTSGRSLRAKKIAIVFKRLLRWCGALIGLKVPLLLGFSLARVAEIHILLFFYKYGTFL